MQNAPKTREEEHSRVEEHILKNYELLEFKGKGAYGIVWKAIDRKTREVVALKKVFDAFHNATDAQRTFREVIYLEQLTQHHNIIRLQNVIKAENNKDLYMVFDFMETDLHKVIRANILEPIHKKYVIYQLLKALKYIHSAELIHRDLKPSNLLINSECKIKLADFGLARSINSNSEDIPVMTEYVATRWYRAPEILLGSQKYSKAVDIWSVGCILGEMILGKAIFPGTSTINQIEKVIELLGRPKNDDLEAIQSQLAYNVLASINSQKKKSIGQSFSSGGEDAIDFIRKCLIYNPLKRMTIEQCMIHPYIKDFLGTEDEITKDSPIITHMDDNRKFSVKEYREALYNHIQFRKKLENRSLIKLEQFKQLMTHDDDSLKEELKKFIHHTKSQSNIQPRPKKHMSQDAIMTDQIGVSQNQSPLVKKKSQEAIKANFFPNVDSKEQSPAKHISRKISVDKKMKGIVSPNQIIQQTGNNYFFNSTNQKPIEKHSSQPNSQNNSMNKNNQTPSQKSQVIGTQYLAYLKNQMGATNYGNLFSQGKIKFKK